MSDAPERIWYNGSTQHSRELRWIEPESDIHPQIAYIRADLHDDLVKAADELANHTAQQLFYMDLCDDKGDLYRNMQNALTAYRKAKEKMNAL